MLHWKKSYFFLFCLVPATTIQGNGSFVVYNLAWSGLLIGYVVEIYPFYLRSRYLPVMLLAGAAGAFFSNYVNPVALEAVQWKYYLFYIICLVIQCVVVYFLYIETKGHTLEKIAVCFDGEDVDRRQP